MTTQPKRMLVHSYNGDSWETKEYPSIRAMQRALRGKGVHLDNTELFRLGDASFLKITKDHMIEIEEAIERDGELTFQGKVYIPAKQYMDRTGKTWRQVHYAYDKGRIEGMKVGKRGYLYLLWEER